MSTITNSNDSNVKLYWIHCNRCFVSYMEKTNRLFLLACYHIFCGTCSPQLQPIGVSLKPTFQCHICKKPRRGYLINNTMPSQIKQLFHPEPWQTGLPNSRIMAFQQKHRQNFIMRMQDIERRMQELETDLDRKRKSLQEMFKELKSTYKQRKYLQTRLRMLIEERKRIYKLSKMNKQHSAPLRATPKTPNTATNRPMFSGGNRPRFQIPNLNPNLRSDAPVTARMTKPYY